MKTQLTIRESRRLFPGRLREALALRGVSGNALARRIGLPPMRVWRWLAGETEPRWSEAERIVEELSLPADYFRDPSPTIPPA